MSFRLHSFLMFALLAASACSTHAPREGAPGDAGSAEKLVARGKNAPARPAWIDLKTPFQYKDGEFVALGHTVTPPGAGIEEGYIIAGNAAKDVICKATQYRLDLAFQDSEEGSIVDRDQIKEIAMDVCSGLTAFTWTGHRYWEKVMTTASNGDRVVVYRVFVTNAVPEKDLKKLVTSAVRKQEGKGQIPKHYSKEFKKRWPRFANAE